MAVVQLELEVVLSLTGKALSLSHSHSDHHHDYGVVTGNLNLISSFMTTSDFWIARMAQAYHSGELCNMDL